MGGVGTRCAEEPAADSGALGYARTPSGHPRGRLGPVVLSALGIVTAIVVPVHLTSSSLVQAALLLGSGLLAIAATGAGLWLNRSADWRPWLLVVASEALLSVVNLAWLGYTLRGVGQSPPETLVLPLQIAGYLGLLAASVLVAMRHATHDRGGVIDAALIGIAVAAPVWEFGLRPALLEVGAPPAAQVTVLVQILVLLGILGALLRIARTTGRRLPTIWLMFAALACTVAGILAVHRFAVDSPELGRVIPSLCFVVGYCCLGAAALHPSAASLMRSIPQLRPEPSAGGLRHLGTYLALIPIVGGIPQLFGHPADGLLMSVGPLLMVPLVLTRLGQLMALRAADQQQLAYHASHDELTALVNRRRLFALIHEAIDQRAHGRLNAVTMLYCDLDDFKPINDRFGHEAGDHVLREVAERLGGSVRAGDVVGRLGGDEFLVLCPAADAAVAQELRARLEQALLEPIRWRDEELRVGVTIGVAVGLPDQSITPDELVAVADDDMYTRKRQRKASQGPR